MFCSYRKIDVCLATARYRQFLSVMFNSKDQCLSQESFCYTFYSVHLGLNCSHPRKMLRGHDRNLTSIHSINKTEIKKALLLMHLVFRDCVITLGFSKANFFAHLLIYNSIHNCPLFPFWQKPWRTDIWIP